MTEIPTQSDRCSRFLRSYLCAVGEALADRGCTIRESTVREPGYQEALCATLTFSLPGEQRTVRAGWHEELGWWAEPCGQTSRRYLRTALVPECAAVVEFLTHVGEMGSVAPTLHRYRLLNPDLADQLAHPVVGGVRA